MTLKEKIQNKYQEVLDIHQQSQNNTNKYYELKNKYENELTDWAHKISGMFGRSTWDSNRYGIELKHPMVSHTPIKWSLDGYFCNIDYSFIKIKPELLKEVQLMYSKIQEIWFPKMMELNTLEKVMNESDRHAWRYEEQDMYNDVEWYNTEHELPFPINLSGYSTFTKFRFDKPVGRVLTTLNFYTKNNEWVTFPVKKNESSMIDVLRDVRNTITDTINGKVMGEMKYNRYKYNPNR